MWSGSVSGSNSFLNEARLQMTVILKWCLKWVKVWRLLDHQHEKNSQACKMIIIIIIILIRHITLATTCLFDLLSSMPNQVVLRALRFQKPTTPENWCFGTNDRLTRGVSHSPDFLMAHFFVTFGCLKIKSPAPCYNHCQNKDSLSY